MSVKIKMRKIGKSSKKRYYYRIVAIDDRKSRDGVFIEQLGFYDPTKEPPIFKINQPRLEWWKKNGAQISATVSSLVRRIDKNATTN